MIFDSDLRPSGEAFSKVAVGERLKSFGDPQQASQWRPLGYSRNIYFLTTLGTYNSLCFGAPSEQIISRTFSALQRSINFSLLNQPTAREAFRIELGPATRSDTDSLRLFSTNPSDSSLILKKPGLLEQFFGEESSRLWF